MSLIRPAVEADVPAIARVDVETWRATYAGMLPDHLLLGLSERQRATAWSRFIAHRPGDSLIAVEPGQGVVGFGSCGLQRNPDLPYAGEIFTLYVTPDFQGRNIGRQLLLSLFARLVRVGRNSTVIWVLKDNPARFFYERLGGRLAATRRFEMGRGVKVEAVGYAWGDLATTIHNRGQARSRID